ncbi:MAG: stalk domain-containing protein [Caldisericia bacterium]|nr:stalk domain-containing protein [Caldisericia bacterium]
MIKKFILFFIISFFSLPYFIYAYENKIELYFSNESFILKYDEQGYIIPIVEGYSNIDSFSDKCFPRKNIKVLLPSNTKLHSFKILNLKTIKLDGKYKLREGNLPYLTGTNDIFYNKKGDFKIDKPIFLLSENNKKGFRFLTFSVYPFLYEKEELYFVKSFKVEIYYLKEKNEEKIYEIEDKDFINYSSMNEYYKNIISNESYEYLIITVDKAYKLLEEHKTYLESKGIKVKLIKASSIDTKLTPENLREFLKKEYKISGFKYLLIVGSPNSIPMKILYAGEEDLDYENKFIPSDFYYADLTSDWDSNKDGLFGEPGKDNIDFYPEISVGRIPFDNELEIKIVLLKTKVFMDKSYEENKKKILFLGAFWHFKNEENKWSQDGDSGYLNNMIFELYLKNKGFLRKSLNELEGLVTTSVKYVTDSQINQKNFIKFVNEFRPGIISWMGHGNWDGTARKIWAVDYDYNGYPTQDEIKWDDFVSNDIVTNFDVKNPSIYYSSSCLNLYPEKDSLAKNILVVGNGVNFIGFSRISWYFPNLTYESFDNNPSMYTLNAMFLNFLSSKNTIGESIYKTISWYYEKFWNQSVNLNKILAHNIYCLNIFGEPIISLETFTEKVINPKVIYTNPSNNQSDVPINIEIVIKFDRNLDKKTVNLNNLIVQEGTKIVQGYLNYNEIEFSIIFKPTSELKKGTFYTVTIKKDIKDIFGNGLQNDYKFSFKTISEIQDFIVVFYDKDEGYKIDLKSCSILNQKDFLLLKINSYRNWGDPTTDFRILIYLEVDNDQNTGWPKEDNGNGEDYLIWIGTYDGKFYSDINNYDKSKKTWNKIEDLESNVLKNSNEANIKIPKKYFILNRFGFWVAIRDIKYNEFDYYPNDDDPEYYSYFDILSKPQKLDILDYYPKNQSIVSPNTEIYVKFSNNILSQTLNQDTFYVKKGDRFVSGKIVYDKEQYIAKFVPDSLLEEGSIYKVFLSKNITDLNGNNLLFDFTIEFQTQKISEGEYILQYVSPRSQFSTIDLSRIFILSDGRNLSFKIEVYSSITKPSDIGFFIRMDIDNNPNSGVPRYPYGGNGEDYSIYVGGYQGQVKSFILNWKDIKWEIVEENKNFIMKQNINYVIVTIPISKIGNPKEINYWVGSTDDTVKFTIVDNAPTETYYLKYYIVGKKGWIKQFEDLDEGFIYDLKSSYIMHDDKNVYFKVETFRGWKDLNNEKFFVQINIDSDQNSLTGKESPDGMGEDFLIHIGTKENETGIFCELWIWEEDGWYIYEELKNFRIENNSNMIEVTLPLELIGSPKKFNYWVGVGTWLNEDEFDYFPNDDDPNYYLEYDTTKIISEDAIQLIVDIPDNLVTDKESILVKGKTNKDAKVTINNEEVLVSSVGFFAKIVNLKQGENIITVKAFDNAGNSKEIRRKVVFSKTVSKVSIELFIGKKVAILNGLQKEIDAPPFIKDGRTLVPIRFIAEAFGAEVQWDGSTKTVRIYLSSKNIKIILQIDNKISYVNDKKIILDVPPLIKDGRTFVPIRFIAESFGAEVQWDGVEKKITIIYSL